jgi:SAM-dependent methyltransferase
VLGRFRAKTASAITRIAREHGSPERLFAACVVGGMIGATPFFGLHFVLAVGLAMLLRLNRVAVYAAANISIPPLAPFLALACIEVGRRVTHTSLPPLSLEALRHAVPWKLAGAVFASWLAGAPIVGGAIGAVLGGAVYLAARARDRAKHARAGDPFAFAELELRARFRAAPTSIRQYVRWKVKLDPVYRALALALPDAVEIVDLGCGLAISGILLSLLGTRRRVVGIDRDAKKLGLARAAAVGLPITLDEGDVRTFTPPPCDAVLLVDVLHYFDDDTQRAILRTAADALRPGGVLLVREGDREGRGVWLTTAFERIAVAVGWNRSDARPVFRSLDALRADLAATGLTVRTVPLAGPLHPGNVLLRGEKPAAADDPTR